MTGIRTIGLCMKGKTFLLENDRLLDIFMYFLGNTCEHINLFLIMPPAYCNSYLFDCNQYSGCNQFVGVKYVIIILIIIHHDHEYDDP